MTFIKGRVMIPWDPNDPVYPVNSCFTQISEWRTKSTSFVTIFPWGCTEFSEFSVFREVPEYCRFSRFVSTLLLITVWLCLFSHTHTLHCPELLQVRPVPKGKLFRIVGRTLKGRMPFLLANQWHQSIVQPSSMLTSLLSTIFLTAHLESCMWLIHPV